MKPKRVAIIGGGISGLTAAYELELARKRGEPVDWHLYEASDRLGGIIETTRFSTPEGEWILEGGPDAWVSEKPWARELAIELGLEYEFIDSNDATRKTYILIDGKLQAMPDGMRMMVPTDLATLDQSPLFSASAKQAYCNELARAEDLKASAPDKDESVANFVRRHFGDEVLEKVAGPLLAGVFGGDVHKLSVRAVMAPFVKMEQEHGSLILALQRKAAERGDKPQQPTFTSLRRGMGSLGEALVATLPKERLHLQCKTEDLWDDPCWQIVVDDPSFRRNETPKPLWVDRFDEIVFCTSLDAVRCLLPGANYDLPFRQLLPTDASSAVLATFCWTADTAQAFTVPSGFGFLVPQSQATQNVSSRPTQDSSTVPRSGETCSFHGASTSGQQHQPQILAATFTNQKFPHRTPAGARAIRVFFGSNSAERFADTPDAEIAEAAFHQLASILGPLPEPDASLTTVRRWPRSLPQYEVGHLDRMAQLDELVSRVPGLHLLGNSYRGVGLPDLIRDARSTARTIIG